MGGRARREIVLERPALRAQDEVRLRAAILAHMATHGPLTATGIASALGWERTYVDPVLLTLIDAGRLSFFGRTPEGMALYVVRPSEPALLTISPNPRTMT